MTAYERSEIIASGKLAKKLGVPEATLNRWLRGKTNISNAYRAILKDKGII